MRAWSSASRVMGMVGLLCAAACGDDSSGSGGSGSTGTGTTGATGTDASSGETVGTGGAGTGGAGSTGAGEACEATFFVLQKDAYKDTAGRSSDLWPPHTTTVLHVVCDGAIVDSAFQANHGTEPGQADANGDVILVEMATFPASGTRAELTALLDAYRGCDCEDTTPFLSLDSLQGDLAQGLMETVLGYLQTNLECPGDTLADLLQSLQDGDVETAVTIFPTCSWIGGASFEEGLSDAFSELLAATGEQLDGYHVCNNDALVQKALFDGFVADGSVECPGGDLCRGPLWFYVAE